MRLALSDIPLIKRILRSRWLQWSLMAITPLFFVLAILAGLFGTPAGNRNFGIVFVWIVWWGLLILLLVAVRRPALVRHVSHTSSRGVATAAGARAGQTR